MGKRRISQPLPPHNPHQHPNGSDVKLVDSTKEPERRYEHADYRITGLDYLPGDVSFRNMASYEEVYVGRVNIHTMLSTLLSSAGTLIHDSQQRAAKVQEVARQYLGTDLGLEALVQTEGNEQQKKDALLFLVALEKARSPIAGLAREYRLKIQDTGVSLSEKEEQSIEDQLKKQQ